MTTKTLTRSRDDRWIGGVCGGVADYTGIDATLIRLVFVIGTILGAGSLLIGYAVAWILIPRRSAYVVPSQQAAWAEATDAPATAPAPGPPSA